MEAIKAMKTTMTRMTIMTTISMATRMLVMVNVMMVSGDRTHDGNGGGDDDADTDDTDDDDEADSDDDEEEEDDEGARPSCFHISQSSQAESTTKTHCGPRCPDRLGTILEGVEQIIFNHSSQGLIRLAVVIGLLSLQACNAILSCA